MNPMSGAAYVFSSVKVDFLAPDFIKSEFAEHKDRCLSYSKLSEHEFEIRQAELEKNITFFRLSEYRDFLDISANALPDPDDADFLALALAVNAEIWSNDPHLKQQSLVRVYSTKELIDKLLKEEL